MPARSILLCTVFEDDKEILDLIKAIEIFRFWEEVVGSRSFLKSLKETE